MRNLPQLPVLTGDRTRITQVFQNLIENAIKYLHTPDGVIDLGFDENDDFLIFSVTDNGPGIAPQYYEKIFHIFQTLVPRDTRESNGIGLALTKKIVELYGGNIRVESEPEKVSTFTFTLAKQTRVVDLPSQDGSDI